MGAIGGKCTWRQTEGWILVEKGIHPERLRSSVIFSFCRRMLESVGTLWCILRAPKYSEKWLLWTSIILKLVEFCPQVVCIKIVASYWFRNIRLSVFVQRFGVTFADVDEINSVFFTAHLSLYALFYLIETKQILCIYILNSCRFSALVLCFSSETSQIVIFCFSYCK